MANRTCEWRGKARSCGAGRTKPGLRFSARARGPPPMQMTPDELMGLWLLVAVWLLTMGWVKGREKRRVARAHPRPTAGVRGRPQRID